MTQEMKKQRQAAANKNFNAVLSAVHALLRAHGFSRHGRVFHRFVEGDISQVVELQRGPAYLEQTHLFWVCVGIRIPECALRTFAPEETAAYHREAECDLRYTLGEQSRRKTGAFDLRKQVEEIVPDVLARLEQSVLPAFAALSSREAILARRSEYPQFFVGWLAPLMEAMIWGRRGDLQRAEALFNAYYHAGDDTLPPAVVADHRAYLRELAQKLGVCVRE